MSDTVKGTLEKEQMKTLSVCLSSLTAAGYQTQFKATDNGLLSLKTQKIFNPHDVKIKHYYRFEGESDPADNAIVYGIETSDGERGTLVDAYGPYNDSKVTTFIQQVHEIHK